LGKEVRNKDLIRCLVLCIAKILVPKEFKLDIVRMGKHLQFITACFWTTWKLQNPTQNYNAINHEKYPLRRTNKSF
jgi:hypothetical protein